MSNARIRKKRAKCKIESITPGDVAVIQFDPNECGIEEAFAFFEAACKYLPYETVAILLPKCMDLEYWTNDQLWAWEARVKEVKC